MVSVNAGQRPRYHDVATRSMATRRRPDLGLVLLRSAAEPLLLRYRQSGRLEPRPTARRQQVGDDDLRTQPGNRRGEAGLPGTAAGEAGIRWAKPSGAV